MALKDLGLRPCGTVATAGDAIRAAAVRRPDVVMMDVMLAGGSNGLAATRDIVSSGGPPVIVCSGHTSADDAARAGAAAFVPKPYSPVDLLRALERVLAPLRFDRPSRSWTEG